MLLGYLLLFIVGLSGAFAFHHYATRDSQSFERAIQWSTRYILVPATLVQDRGLPAQTVLPLVRIIDQIFIAAAGGGPENDAHLYWQGRLLLPLATTYGRLGDGQRQLARGHRAVEIFATLASRHPAAIDYRRRLARAHDLLADDLADFGHFDAAASHYRSSLLIVEGLRRDEPGAGRWLRYQAEALAGIAATMHALGRSGASGDLYRQAQATARQVPAEFTTDAEWRRIVTRIEEGLASP